MANWLKEVFTSQTVKEAKQLYKDLQVSRVRIKEILIESKQSSTFNPKTSSNPPATKHIEPI